MSGDGPQSYDQADTTTIHSEAEAIPLPTPGPMASGACLIQIHPVVGRCGVQHLGLSTIIGRDKNADFFVQLDSVSRQHAKIERLETGAFRLIDLDSTNGTFVNDVKVREWDLGPNDMIRCGGTILKLLPTDDLEAQYHEVAYMMMTHDSMTGIFNRQYFDDMLEREVASSVRYQRSLSLLILDLDHFKAINDLHGHLAGDDTIREFSRRVTTIMRKEAVFARLGGEEFGVILPEADAAEAKRVAERIRLAISSREVHLAHAQARVSVSIGVATTCGSTPVTAQKLLQEADQNLYEAKRTGRDRVCETVAVARIEEHHGPELTPCASFQGYAAAVVVIRCPPCPDQVHQRWSVLMICATRFVFAFVFLFSMPCLALGASERVAPELDDAALNAVFFRSTEHGFAVGTHGTIWQTADGGQSWKLKPSPVAGLHEAVTFVNAKTGWVVGSSTMPTNLLPLGYVLRTEDGGETWKLLAGQPSVDPSRPQAGHRYPATAS